MLDPCLVMPADFRTYAGIGNGGSLAVHVAHGGQGEGFAHDCIQAGGAIHFIEILDLGRELAVLRPVRRAAGPSFPGAQDCRMMVVKGMGPRSEKR